MELALFICAGVLSVFELIFLIETIVEYRMCSGRTLGTITEVTTVKPWAFGLLGRRPYTRYYLTYEYGDKDAKHKIHGISRIRKPKSKAGDSDVVFYNPKNPEEAFVWYDARQMIGNHAVTIIVILLCFLVITLI